VTRLGRNWMATTHGMSETPEYHAWESMKLRCAGGKQYPTYKARGTTVCERWTRSFVAFYQDVGPRPSPEHSLDRIDNDGNYEPGNVRWSTRKQQQRNTKRTVFVAINGVIKSRGEWAEFAGISEDALKSRLRRNWSPVRLLEPTKNYRRRRNAPQLVQSTESN
jgi:hypothetical protein